MNLAVVSSGYLNDFAVGSSVVALTVICYSWALEVSSLRPVKIDVVVAHPSRLKEMIKDKIRNIFKQLITKVHPPFVP